ncbi:Calcium/calmodulin-dependent 3',5'-cyclic nucleotide phosphodiesterase 1A [Manis javanica]|nr:Calcium/calmodulin-dependent 3',5'-cyclic nucleotide phosphodiesterase 1A [Manis javanica]
MKNEYELDGKITANCVQCSGNQLRKRRKVLVIPDFHLEVSNSVRGDEPTGHSDADNMDFVDLRAEVKYIHSTFQGMSDLIRDSSSSGSDFSRHPSLSTSLGNVFWHTNMEEIKEIKDKDVDKWSFDVFALNEEHSLKLMIYELFTRYDPINHFKVRNMEQNSPITAQLPSGPLFILMSPPPFLVISSRHDSSSTTALKTLELTYLATAMQTDTKTGLLLKFESPQEPGYVWNDMVNKTSQLQGACKPVIEEQPLHGHDLHTTEPKVNGKVT